MAALRRLFAEDDSDRSEIRATRRPDPADWLTLQQAACELGVSISTARRMIHKGKLRHRILPRPGGFSYLVHVPGSRHARLVKDERAHADGAERAPRPLRPRARPRAARQQDPDRDEEVRRLEEQVERLSEALARALRGKRRALPSGMGQPGVNPNDPYARLRWLARRKRFRIF